MGVDLSSFGNELAFLPAPGRGRGDLPGGQACPLKLTLVL